MFFFFYLQFYFLIFNNSFKFRICNFKFKNCSEIFNADPDLTFIHISLKALNDESIHIKQVKERSVFRGILLSRAVSPSWVAPLWMLMSPVRKISSDWQEEKWWWEQPLLKSAATSSALDHLFKSLLDSAGWRQENVPHKSKHIKWSKLWFPQTFVNFSLKRIRCLLQKHSNYIQASEITAEPRCLICTPTLINTLILPPWEMRIWMLMALLECG